MDLQEIRKEIDRVDGELLELFEKRMGSLVPRWQNLR